MGLFSQKPECRPFRDSRNPAIPCSYRAGLIHGVNFANRPCRDLAVHQGLTRPLMGFVFAKPLRDCKRALQVSSMGCFRGAGNLRLGDTFCGLPPIGVDAGFSGFKPENRPGLAGDHSWFSGYVPAPGAIRQKRLGDRFQLPAHILAWSAGSMRESVHRPAGGILRFKIGKIPELRPCRKAESGNAGFPGNSL